MPTDAILSATRQSAAGSPPHGGPDVAEPTPEKFEFERLVVDAGHGYGAHFHAKDQLSWMAGVAMEIEVGGHLSVLRREHLVWIPAGVLHEMRFREAGEVVNLYTDPALRPAGPRWTRPTTVGLDPLTAALMWHLSSGPRSLARTRLSLDLLRDLLASAPVARDVVTLPDDSRARVVAQHVLADPADQRDLEQWAEDLGVSSRTLSRAFRAETGAGFRTWRSRVRMNAASDALAQGCSVADAAESAGYSGSSAFIAAFREHFATTPARYAREHAPSAPGFTAAIVDDPR